MTGPDDPTVVLAAGAPNEERDSGPAAASVAGAGVEPEPPRGAREFERRRWRARWLRVRPYLYTVLAIALLGAGVWAVFFSSYLSAERVDVSGTEALRPGQVKRVAKVRLGVPLARVDTGAIRARVETIPEVADAKVSRGWPHTVRIAVTERVALAMVDRGDGVWSVDREGVLFGHRRAAPPGTPLIRAASDVDAETLAEAAQVVAALRPDILDQVDSVDAESVDRIRLRLTGQPARTVWWGSAEQSAQKAEVLAVLLGDVPKSVREIDVSVPGRPTTR